MLWYGILKGFLTVSDIVIHFDGTEQAHLSHYRTYVASYVCRYRIPAHSFFLIRTYVLTHIYTGTVHTDLENLIVPNKNTYVVRYQSKI